ncbi:MAG: hypothetical protein E7773_07925 [Sphingomonas sp.]|uniref:hypothetical protein n=1 Tax=Sphingomonas sp. TaxID=28214 RepID=UPI00122311D0|nr:hypothetical protein [Sphingomonas sp.]THD35868.1 MAG: hypothetical protein E7773_07925 [Sphingomonas sp.]
MTVDSADPTPRVIAFRYNPSTLKRSLQPQMVGGDDNARSAAVRFTGPPSQIVTIEIELDASDDIGTGQQAAVQYAALPQLAALELLVYPALAAVKQAQGQLASGVMEIAPLTAPRTLFVWGQKRVLPVRIASYDINEEFFDSRLNPIRATVTLAMHVLTYADVSPDNHAYFTFTAYQQALNTIAAQATGAAAPSIGVDSGAL